MPRRITPFNERAEKNKQAKILLDAVRKRDASTIEALLDAGLPVDTRDDFGATALFTAANLGFKDIAELVLRFGADVNAATNDGMTPLMVAAGSGHGDMLRLLLAHRADPQRRDCNGDDALDWAASCGHRSAVEILEPHYPISLGQSPKPTPKLSWRIIPSGKDAP